MRTAGKNWTTIAVRTAGSDEWDELPRAVVPVVFARVLHAAGQIQLQEKSDKHGQWLLQVREA